MPTRRLRIAIRDHSTHHNLAQYRYVVEKILAHTWDPSLRQFIYHVKWQGYEDKADMTWEPAENLATAADIMDEYHDSIGGVPQPPAGGKGKRGPKKRPLEEDTPDPKRASVGSGRGRGRKKQNTGDDDSSDLIKDEPVSKKDKYPIKGATNWDDHIVAVTTIEEHPSKMGTMERWGYLIWDNKQGTRHRLHLLHQHAPQSVRFDS
jgi:chromobox protein 1